MTSIHNLDPPAGIRDSLGRQLVLAQEAASGGVRYRTTGRAVDIRIAVLENGSTGQTEEKACQSLLCDLAGRRRAAHIGSSFTCWIPTRNRPCKFIRHSGTGSPFIIEMSPNSSSCRGRSSRKENTGSLLTRPIPRSWTVAVISAFLSPGSSSVSQRLKSSRSSLIPTPFGSCRPTSPSTASKM